MLLGTGFGSCLALVPPNLCVSLEVAHQANNHYTVYHEMRLNGWQRPGYPESVAHACLLYQHAMVQVLPCALSGQNGGGGVEHPSVRTEVLSSSQGNILEDETAVQARSGGRD